MKKKIDLAESLDNLKFRLNCAAIKGKTELKYLPITITANYRAARANGKHGDEWIKKAVEKQEKKEEERVYKEEISKANEQQRKESFTKYSDDIRDAIADRCNDLVDPFKKERVHDLSATASKTQFTIINYAYYYMTDKNAKLVTRFNMIEKEIINGISSVFDFGKIFPEAVVGDLRRYDLRYEDFCPRSANPDYILSIADIIKKTELIDFMEKVNQRKAQLGIKAEKVILPFMPKHEVTEQEKAGLAGEKAVEYMLKTLLNRDDYIVFPREDTGTKLKSQDMVQEIDHIVIGKQGVFLIESKYYKGKLIIDENQQWIQEKDGKSDYILNPIPQVRRHHIVVKSLLKIDDIFDIICIAHPHSLIDGQTNSAIPVIKVDMLCEYISAFKNNSGREYSRGEMEEMRRKLDENRCN